MMSTQNTEGIADRSRNFAAQSITSPDQSIDMPLSMKDITSPQNGTCIEKIKYGTIDSIEEHEDLQDDEDLDAVNDMLDPMNAKTAKDKRAIYAKKNKT